jgi:uncharacterized protein (TIGR00255 family)
MSLRSMTGFARQRGEFGATAYTLTLKSVNHRFLDLHLRLPQGSEMLEQQARSLLKQKVGRGHVEFTLSLEQASGAGVSVNRRIVAGYVEAYREMAAEFGIGQAADLNAALRLNGALGEGCELPEGAEFERAVLDSLAAAVEEFNRVREQEGARLVAELRQRMAAVEQLAAEAEQLRASAQQAIFEKLQARIAELLGSQGDQGRLMQEAALLAERSDIQEEIVRLKTHAEAFCKLLDEESEAGKKMDFLLQELNREANTLLSKTSGITGEALRITSVGLALKSEIEKSREQVQNIE